MSKTIDSQNQTPLVSVVIPIYNSDPYLEQCLSSIANQTYQNLEIWLLNDHSTDKSLEICESFRLKDPRFHVVEGINPCHHGCGALRNQGISLVNGEFTYFIDSDDWAYEDTIERMVKIQQKENSDIVVGNFCKYVTETGIFKIHKRDNNYYEKTFSPVDWIAQEYVAGDGISICTLQVAGKLYRTSILKQVAYRSNVNTEDDFTQYKIYLMSERITFVNDHFFVYRIHEDSLNHSGLLTDRFTDKSREERIAVLASLGLPFRDQVNSYLGRLGYQSKYQLKEGTMQAYKNACAKKEIIRKYGGWTL